MLTCSRYRQLNWSRANDPEIARHPNPPHLGVSASTYTGLKGTPTCLWPMVITKVRERKEWKLKDQSIPNCARECGPIKKTETERQRERDRDSQYKTPCCVVRNTYGRSYKYSCHISHTEKADILEMIGASEPIKRWVWKGLSRSWTCFYKHLDTLQFARWVEVALLCCFQFHANQVEFAFLPKTCV